MDICSRAPAPLLGARREPALVLARLQPLDGSAARDAAIACSGEGLVTGVFEPGETCGAARRVLDFRELVITPGLVDAHTHLVGYGFAMRRLNLAGLTHLADVQAAVAARAAELPAGAWVLGGGWDATALGFMSPPLAAWLDAASPRNPVSLTSRDVHATWANSVALRVACLDANTPNPTLGRVVRDASGCPNGAFYESPARRLVELAIPAPTAAEYLDAAMTAADDFARRGFVAVHTMALEEPDALRSILILEAQGTLPLRVWACLGHQDLAPAQNLGLIGGFGARARVGGVKFFSDGSLGSRTAAFLEPYAGGAQGLWVDDPAVIEERSAIAIGLGFTPTVHAIGDAANRAVIEVFERLAPLARAAGVRLRLEHAQHIHPADIARLKLTGAVASVQPIHLPGDVPAIRAVLSGEREAQAYPLGALMRAGVPLALGSDAPVVEPTVSGNLRAACEREDERGLPFHAEQAISRLEALRAYTFGGAFAAGQESWSGRITPGFLAEFTLWNADPLTDPMAEPVRALVWPCAE